MPFRFASEETAVRDCALNAFSNAQAYVASSEGISALATLESDNSDGDGGSAVEQFERAAETARNRSGSDVEIIFDDGSLSSLFISTFMDAVLLGAGQAEAMVDFLARFDGEVDARIVAGALAYENQTGFDDAMIWLHALSLAGLLDTEVDEHVS